MPAGQSFFGRKRPYAVDWSNCPFNCRSDGEWLYFDYVPGETDIRRGAAGVTGRFCVIGSHIQEEALKELFKIG